MNVNITTFINPFSFFCINENRSEVKIVKFNSIVDEHKLRNSVEKYEIMKSKLLNVSHGQYVAVMWKNKWVRGVVSMETKCLIWLIDYGIFLNPSESTVCLDLPLDYKKLPTKIFEASIHGVVPVDKVLSDDCQIINSITNTWMQSTINKCQEILEKALRTYFQPIALLSSPDNDVVLGDLYVELKDKGYVNIIEELEEWPVYLEHNREVYIKNFSKFYTTRRRHRIYLLKPDLPDTLPVVNMDITLDKYLSIVANSPNMEMSNEEAPVSEVGSTVVEHCQNKEKSDLKITPSDIERYSNSFITVRGRKYNMLTVLINKVRDFKMCQRYKDHDLKSIGRGYSYRPLHFH